MPKQRIVFGSKTIDVELPERARVLPAGLGGSKLPAVDETEAVAAALASPLGLPRLAELARPGARVLLAFDDPTVPSYGPIRKVAIEAALAELSSAGARETDVQLVCANALHRKFTREELAMNLGPELVDRFAGRLSCHDAEDPDRLVHLGTTPEGYDVEVHRDVAEADLVVYVNAGSHLGFGGGWKSVCVGLSTWRSIRWTHTPDGMSMSLHKNRMHAVFDKMGAHLESTLGKRVFKIETVLSNPFQVAAVHAGGVDETRKAAIEQLASVHAPRRSAGEPADVVLYGVPAWSPYAVFARMNPILTLLSSGLGYLGGYIEALGKPGCTVILATPCPVEWDDEHHPAYRDVWDNVLTRCRDPYRISEEFLDEYAARRDYIEQYRSGVAFHPVHAILATHPLKRLGHAGRVIVAGAQDPSAPARLGFETSASVEDALRRAEEIHGRDCSIVCIDVPATM